MMDWVKSNWLKLLIVVFASAGWVTHQEMEAQEGMGHRRQVCYEECIKHCKAWCEIQGIQADECECVPLCEERCG